jgi:1,6-anhydro-N-acetylmuramate kinase
MDSVDAALCEITSNHCTLLAYDEYPFDQALKEECFELINATTTLAKVSEIDTRLALLFSTAINTFIQKT